MMRFVTILILCFGVFSCLSKSEQRTNSLIPVMTSTAELQKNASTEKQKTDLTGIYCENVADVLGFADISFDATTVIYFYAKPNTSENPAQTLRFYEDKTINSLSFRSEGEKSYSLLNPERYKLDYSIFDLNVKSRRNGWLEVKVDEQTNETLWLQESKSVRFENWQQVMKEAFAIGRINTEINPLRTKPNLTARIIDFNESDCLKFEQMQGDWIKVTQSTHCNTDLNSKPSGWIRWRDENGCLLIEIFPFA